MSDNGMNICIIGAGVVGLTTALKLQATFGRSLDYTLIADQFKQETTSHGAAGIFRPSTNFIVSTAEVTWKCINDSYRYYLDLLNQDCGISEISGYVFSKTDPTIVRNHYLENLVPIYRQVSEDELRICPGNWKYGSYFSTLLIECRHYLPWATEKFKGAGGRIIKKKIYALSDLDKFGKFDILINCTGLGSKKLFEDSRMVPIRGQVFKVHAPWLNKFYYGDYDTYIIPGSEGVATLGGTRQFESWRTEVCKYDSAGIWERCTDLVPQLKNKSRVLNEWVGLRPHRDSGVRIETEIVNGFKVIHNYGHGGYGVTSSPGTADQVVQLVFQLLKYCTSKL